MDMIFILLIAVFFGLSVAIVNGCEKLRRPQ
jgi:hypothetical protein